MQTTRILGSCGVAAAATVLGMAAAASAGVVYDTRNIQYTNVNVAADQHAYTVIGEVGHTGVMVAFDGYGPDPFMACELHGQHGVAFVEAFNPTDIMHRMTMTAQAPWGFTAADWKLDAAPPFDGLIKFTAYDSSGNVLPVSSGSDTFPFGHNGQNPFNVTVVADGGSIISKLEMTSIPTGGPSSVIAPILDLKEVSVNVALVPEPATVLTTVGLLALGVRRRIA